MNSVLQLALVAFFALVAAGLNAYYLVSQTTPTTYTALRSNLDQGVVIEDEDLIAVPIPGDPLRLKSAMIPYANRSILLGLRTSRAYEAGDVILARDLVAPVEQRQWDVIGPFELISVAERFKQPSRDRDTPSDSIGRNTVTIAVDAGFDRDTSRLLEAIASGSVRDQNSHPLEIVAVQVVPAIDSRTPTNVSLASRDSSRVDVPAEAGRRDVVYQTVSLEGIASVPGVLLEGDFIRFVVPKPPGY